MDKKSRTAMTVHYTELLHKHGSTKEALVYRDKKQQISRYALLTDIGPMAVESSVLDVGCGLGHFCEYLRQYGWKGKYLGLDINADMIRAAQERLPDEEFLCVDLLTEEFQRQNDYVFCGATIQHRPKYGDPQQYLEQMVKEMFSLARMGLAFDIFSGRTDYQDESHLYANPEELLEFCYGLTGRVVLRNDSRPYELMMYLYRDESTDELNIYSDWTPRTPQFV